MREGDVLYNGRIVHQSLDWAPRFERAYALLHSIGIPQVDRTGEDRPGELLGISLICEHLEGLSTACQSSHGVAFCCQLPDEGFANPTAGSGNKDDWHIFRSARGDSGAPMVLTGDVDVLDFSGAWEGLSRIFSEGSKDLQLRMRGAC